MKAFLDDIEYDLIRSKRKSILLRITPEGDVVVRAPLGVSQRIIREYLKEKKTWILEKQKTVRQSAKERLSDKMTVMEREAHRQMAKEIFAERTAYFANQMGLEYHRITVREQKTRWGSCSSRKNLNFNWKLLLAPSQVLDYVVVHELAHLKEMNHSKNFYKEVEKIMPDYRIWQGWLRDNGKYL